MKKRTSKIIQIAILVALIVGFYFITQNLSAKKIQEMGLRIPLPLFTFIIALIDGFNPCTLWALTFLLTILIMASAERGRIFIVGAVYTVVIYAFYFTFMAAWLNIYKLTSAIDPIRIIIGIIAIGMGLINCKDFFFFKKGISLTIQDKHKKPLVKKMDKVRETIKEGSFFALLGAAAVLSFFASLVELPCTAGWPVIYTKILSEKGLEQNATYYLYLVYYNFIYIIPDIAVIIIFGTFFRKKQLSEKGVRWLKLIGGVIMIILGIILLFNPELLSVVE